MSRATAFVRTHAILVSLGLFLGGFAIGLLTDGNSASAKAFNLALDLDAGYSYIRPLIGIQTGKDYTGRLAPLRSQIAAIAAAEPKDALSRYAFYYRNLTTAEWTGINEEDQFDPASMLKIVVALAAYKQNEVTPGFLSQQLTYTQDLANINAAFPFAPPVSLKVGQSYSVPYLLELMLSDSDNGSKDLLLANIDQTVIDKVYTDLSIPKPNDDNSAGYTISPLDYSRFLRVIYYGTYDLTWKNSDNLLGLLAQATYTNGLVAGVPSAIKVAHKYGEHVIGTDGQADGVELSDCGIVYHPQHPYLICVMTEGKDPLQLAHFIADVSRATYNFVNSAS